MDWTNNFFGEYYLKTHLPVLTDERTKLEVDFLEKILELKQGDSILDVPCGHGRHAILLAEKGFKVTGVDRQAEFIKIAKENSNSPNIAFYEKDMLDIDFQEEFDIVLNLFTSFGYFSEKQNFDFLLKMAKSLKPGGKLLLDTVNREWALNQTGKTDQAWLVYPPDNLTFLATNNFDLISSRMTSEQLIIENGKKYEMYQDIRLYTFTELNFLLNRVGLSVTNCFGNFLKEPYTVESTNMILVAEKI